MPTTTPLISAAPGPSTTLFRRLGPPPLDTLCHLSYPASTPGRARSDTALILCGGDGAAVAERRVAIACGGSLFWRYWETFDPAARDAA